MKKFIKCAKCDSNVEPKKTCDCGNTLAGFCRKHKVLYELNCLPQCPVCITANLTKESKSKLKIMMQERKGNAVLIITSADGVRMKTTRDPKESSHPSYIPAPPMAQAPKAAKPISARVAAKMAKGTWL